MSKNKNDLFGGFFDFNGDGKTSIDEEWIAFKIMEDVNKSSDEEHPYSAPKPNRSYAKQPEKPIPDEVHLSMVSAAPDQAQYKKEKRQYRGGILITLIVSSFLMIFPIAVMYAAIASYDEKNSASGFLILIFMVAGLIAMGLIIRTAYSSIRIDVLMLRQLKTNYINAMEDTERTRFLNKKKKAQFILFSLAGAVLFILFALLIAHSVQRESIYKQAESCISSADYVGAQDLLSQIESSDYKDTESLLLLCKAHDEYESGHAIDAYYTIQKVVFRYQDTVQTNSIKQFKTILEEEYDNYINQMAEKRQQEYYNKITNGVPFVGMSEASISSTTLGSPSSKVRHNYECISGEQYLANLYDFYNGGKKIFTARCVNGKVTEVWDERNTTSYVPNYSSSSKADKDSDPYDANSYYHAEDFYDDHYDDFFDYEDAEDYFNEHHK